MLDQDTRVMKYLNGWLNTGQQKGLFGKKPTCPGHYEETQLHIFQCTHYDAVATWNEAFRSLQKYYHKYELPKHVHTTIVRLCWAACEKQPIDTDENNDSSIRNAISDQQRLGTKFLLRGYLSSKWITALRTNGDERPGLSMSCII